MAQTEMSLEEQEQRVAEYQVVRKAVDHLVLNLKSTSVEKMGSKLMPGVDFRGNGKRDTVHRILQWIRLGPEANMAKDDHLTPGDRLRKLRAATIFQLLDDAKELKGRADKLSSAAMKLEAERKEEEKP